MGKRNCVNPGWNTIQADTGFFHFTGESTFSVTFNSSFHPDHKPTVTLSQAVSGSEIESGELSVSHLNIYLAEVTTTGFVVSASNPNYAGFRYQALAIW